MEEKYVNFYMRFHKAFQNKKSNSLLELNQSRSSKFNQSFILIPHSAGVLKITKNKPMQKTIGRRERSRSLSVIN